jgi:hypothetical protein
MARKIKLAEALLRRKELQQKVDQLRQINQEGLFETVVERKNVTEAVDDVIARVSKITLPQVTAGYDYYAKHLRLIDAAIQQAMILSMTS